jgi:hypothetical protein
MRLPPPDTRFARARAVLLFAGLTTAGGCGDAPVEAPAPADGVVEVLVTTFRSPRLRGYEYELAFGSEQRAARSVGPDTVEFELSAGRHELSIANLHPYCEIDGPASARSVDVRAGERQRLLLHVVCQAAVLDKIVVDSLGYLSAMHPDGSDLQRLFVLSSLGPASISPDGRAIAAGVLGDETQLRRFDADGSHSVRLTSAGGSDGVPSWSPDGTRIAFVRASGGVERLCIIGADGSGFRELTSEPELHGSSLRYMRPTWSPDGLLLVFHTNGVLGRPGLAMIDAAGTNLRMLTNTSSSPAFYGSQPAWSPDGRHLALGYGGNVFIVNTAGGLVKQVTLSDSQTGEVNFQPAWSPDGTALIFVRSADGTLKANTLWRADVETGALQQLSPANQIAFPTWAGPGPVSVAFRAGRGTAR